MSLKLVQSGRQPAQNYLPLFAMNVGDPPPDDHVEERLDIAELLVVRPDVTFFVRVEGEVVDDASIRPGDILVVDRSVEARPGDTVIAVTHGEFSLKAVPRSPHLVSRKEDSSPEIWGVVLWVIHKTR